MVNRLTGRCKSWEREERGSGKRGGGEGDRRCRGLVVLCIMHIYAHILAAEDDEAGPGEGCANCEDRIYANARAFVLHLAPLSLPTFLTQQIDFVSSLSLYFPIPRWGGGGKRRRGRKVGNRGEGKQGRGKMARQETRRNNARGLSRFISLICRYNKYSLCS